MAENYIDEGLTTWVVELDQLKFEVVPDRGGLITSLKWRGTELLYLDRQTLLDPTKNVRGGIPVLFPLCGPVRDGHYEIYGHTFALGQHGFARQNAFTVADHGADFIELSLKADDSTLTGFPFEFELRNRYRLSQGRLWLEQDVVNNSSQPMPFQTGYHPYFLVGASKKIDWHIPASSYVDNENQRLESPFGGKIDLDQGIVDWEFPRLTAAKASFRDDERDLTIEVGYGPEFPYLVVWSVPGKPFVCLEPWSSPRFGMNDGLSLLTLKPGATQHTRVWIGPHAR